MKKILNVFVCVFLFSSFLASIASAQTISNNERTSYNLHRKISLQNCSEVKEIKIEVNEKGCRFNLRVRSAITAGKVKLEIFDPIGKKQSNFSIGCQTDPELTLNSLSPDKHVITEEVIGLTAKLIENPMLGDWLVKITPEKAVGNVTIEFNQDIINTESEN